jgi:hypothetical protein
VAELDTPLFGKYSDDEDEDEQLIREQIDLFGSVQDDLINSMIRKYKSEGVARTKISEVLAKLGVEEGPDMEPEPEPEPEPAPAPSPAIPSRRPSRPPPSRPPPARPVVSMGAEPDPEPAGGVEPPNVDILELTRQSHGSVLVEQLIEQYGEEKAREMVLKIVSKSMAAPAIGNDDDDDEGWVL